MIYMECTFAGEELQEKSKNQIKLNVRITGSRCHKQSTITLYIIFPLNALFLMNHTIDGV